MTIACPYGCDAKQLLRSQVFWCYLSFYDYYVLKIFIMEFKTCEPAELAHYVRSVFKDYAWRDWLDYYLVHYSNIICIQWIFIHVF